MDIWSSFDRKEAENIIRKFECLRIGVRKMISYFFIGNNFEGIMSHFFMPQRRIYLRVVP